MKENYFFFILLLYDCFVILYMYFCLKFILDTLKLPSLKWLKRLPITKSFEQKKKH